MLIVMTAVAALLASSQPAAPQPAPAQPSADAAAAAAGDEADDPVICRRERVLGSNRPQRICMTRSEWQQIRDAARETRDRSLRETPYQQGEGGGGVSRGF